MNTTTERKTGNAVESSYRNGSYNPFITTSQFTGLDFEAQRTWVWGFICTHKFDIRYSSITPKRILAIYLIVRKREIIERQPILLQVGSNGYATAAQCMTAIAYGDSDKSIPFRSLDYKVKCEDFEDLKSCLRIILEYNRFYSETIINGMSKIFGVGCFYQPSNPNNGKSPFTFYIGRESSPVIYVEFNQHNWGTNIITERNGLEVKYQEYTIEDFKFHCDCMPARIKSDEYSFEANEYLNGSVKSGVARFWFD